MNVDFYTTSGKPPRGRILVVDDNADSADTLSLLLEFLHYETRTAYDGRCAVEVANDWNPDMVIATSTCRSWTVTKLPGTFEADVVLRGPSSLR